MDISLIYNSKDKVSERIILLEFSSLKISSHRVWKLCDYASGSVAKAGGRSALRGALS